MDGSPFKPTFERSSELSPRFPSEIWECTRCLKDISGDSSPALDLNSCSCVEPRYAGDRMGAWLADTSWNSARINMETKTRIAEDLEAFDAAWDKIGSEATINSMPFSLDSQLVASGAGNKTVWPQDAPSITARATLRGHSSWVNSVAFSLGGQLVASGSDDGSVRLWDAATRTTRTTLEGHLGRVSSVAFSPDGKLVASGSDDRTARLWNAATGAAHATLKGHFDWVNSVAFSPDGHLVASGSDDKTVRLWDASTGAARATLQGHSGWVNSVAFSPDSELVASGSDDKTVWLWDATTGAVRAMLKGHPGWVHSVAFSPDGQLIASGSDDGSVRLWDAATRTTRTTLEGHLGRVSSVAFSPDGQLVASGSSDRTVRLWDAATGIARTVCKGHSSWVRSVSFSPDGQLVASGSSDGTVRLWNTTIRAVLARDSTQAASSKMEKRNDIFEKSHGIDDLPPDTAVRYGSDMQQTNTPPLKGPEGSSLLPLTRKDTITASSLLPQLTTTRAKNMDEDLSAEALLAQPEATYLPANYERRGYTVEDNTHDNDTLCTESNSSVDASNDDGGNTSEKSTLNSDRFLAPFLNTTRQALVDKLMQEVWVIFDKTWTANYTTFAGSAPPSSTPSGEPSGERASTSDGKSVHKRQRQEDDEKHSGGGNDRTPKRLPPSHKHPGGDEERLELSCPFRKHDPSKYRCPMYRICARNSWNTVGRVK